VLIGVETFCTVDPTKFGTCIGWHKIDFLQTEKIIGSEYLNKTHVLKYVYKKAYLVRLICHTQIFEH
jgi:hypothetical protein